MIDFTSSWAIALFLHLATLAQAAITSCPTRENLYITARKGFLYHVCLNTDYQGTTVERIANVADATDCVYLCSERAVCTKAVYEPGNKACHIKASTGPMVWVADARWHSITRRADQ